MEDIFTKNAHNEDIRYSSGKTMLFVGGLPLHACDQNLARYFRKYGPLDTIEVQRNPDGKSRGFAFIQYLRAADARTALNLGPHLILGKSVSLQFALDSNVAASMTKMRQTRKLYLSEIPPKVQESDILTALSYIGGVEKLISPRFGIQSRGFCYVIMINAEDYQHLISLGQLLVTSSSGEIHQLKIESAISQVQSKCSDKSTQLQNLGIEPPITSQNRHAEDKSGMKRSHLIASAAQVPRNQSAKGNPSDEQSNLQRPIPNQLGKTSPSHKPAHRSRNLRYFVCCSGSDLSQNLVEGAAEEYHDKIIRISKKISIEDVYSPIASPVSNLCLTLSSHAPNSVPYCTQPNLFQPAQLAGAESNYRFNLRAN
jgi:RNA recognition motif-containing protein